MLNVQLHISPHSSDVAKLPVKISLKKAVFKIVLVQILLTPCDFCALQYTSVLHPSIASFRKTHQVYHCMSTQPT